MGVSLFLVAEKVGGNGQRGLGFLLYFFAVVISCWKSSTSKANLAN